MLFGKFIIAADKRVYTEEGGLILFAAMTLYDLSGSHLQGLAVNCINWRQKGIKKVSRDFKNQNWELSLEIYLLTNLSRESFSCTLGSTEKLFDTTNDGDWHIVQINSQFHWTIGKLHSDARLRASKLRFILGYDNWDRRNGFLNNMALHVLKWYLISISRK